VVVLELLRPVLQEQDKLVTEDMVKELELVLVQLRLVLDKVDTLVMDKAPAFQQVLVQLLATPFLVCLPHLLLLEYPRPFPIWYRMVK